MKNDIKKTNSNELNKTNKALELFNSLSEEKQNEAFNFLTYLNDKDEWDATNELKTPEISSLISQGVRELLSGEFVSFSTIKKI